MCLKTEGLGMPLAWVQFHLIFFRNSVLKSCHRNNYSKFKEPGNKGLIQGTDSGSSTRMQRKFPVLHCLIFTQLPTFLVIPLIQGCVRPGIRQMFAGRALVLTSLQLFFCSPCTVVMSSTPLGKQIAKGLQIRWQVNNFSC